MIHTPGHCAYDIPGSSFGRKKVPDLNPAKFSAGFRKKRRRPEKTSGSKILKNRDDKRLDHTQGNCLCATSSSFSGAHSFHNPTLEPSRSHCPRPSCEWPKSKTITQYKQTCAQAKTSKKKTRSMWQGTPLSLQPCL